MNCATWNNPECPNGMSRPAILNVIKIAAEAAHNLATPTITDAQYNSVMSHYEKYMRDKNCLGNVDNGPGDCAPPNDPNCDCLEMAMNAANVGNWPICITRLMQGH